MMTIVPQTRKQKVKMYMKCKKRELAEMLANRDLLENESGTPIISENVSENVWCGSQGSESRTLTVN